MGEKKDKTRLEAEAYYIENLDATQLQIADLFSVQQKTISAWSIKYNWEEKRNELHTSPAKIKQLLQREALAVAKGEQPTINADAMSKLISAIDKLSSKSSPVVVARILKELDNYISEIDPHLAAKLTEYHKKFLQHRINQEVQ